MRHDPLVTLNDMLQAGYTIQKFRVGLEEDDFYANDLVQSAIIHQLLLLGEAANRLPKTFQEEHAFIPWRKIIDIEEYLIHAYDNVDFVDVWDAITLSVPALIRQIEPLLPPETRRPP